jgi:cellulose synthase operon protein B
MTMKWKLNIQVLFIFSFITLLVFPSHGYAQTHLIQASLENSQDIELSKLGLPAETILHGSFEEVKLVFSLPSSWDLKPGALLNLSISNYFADLIASQADAIPGNLTVGELSVWLNGSKLSSLSLKDSGDFNYSINLDDTISLNRTLQGLNELIFRWDASVSCENGIASTVSILPSSKLHLQYQVTAAPIDLNQFPSPFFQKNSIEPQKVTVLIPDRPTESELQAALVIAAGLGKFSKGEMNIDLIPFNQLVNGAYSGNNLILVGTLNNLAVLNDINFKSIFTNKISSLTVSDNDGVIMEFNSPWKTESTLLIITGKTESGVIKAAAAVSSSTLVTSSEKNMAMVKEIYQNIPQAEEKVDLLFSELNQPTIEITNYGRQQLEIPFTIPKSKIASPEAYLDLYVNHSKLIDYNQSGLWVKLNGIPIGSMRFNDQTSDSTLVRFIIPPSAIKSFANKIEIETNLVSRNTCPDPRVADHWITIFGDSYLHIPMIQESSKLRTLPSIGDYPLPFLSDEGLSSTTIVVENNDPQSWKTASALAFNFGAEGQGDSFLFQVRFPNRINLESSKDQHLLIIGLTNKIPFSTNINNLLPIPFNTEGGLQDESKLKIKYEVKDNQPLGYLELANISTSLRFDALLVLGSNSEGIEKAGQILLNAKMRDKMIQSNFVLIHGEKLFPDYFETRLITNSQTGQIETEKSSQTIITEINRWTWIGLVGILVVLVFLIGLTIMQAFHAKKEQKIKMSFHQKTTGKSSDQTLKNK